MFVLQSIPKNRRALVLKEKCPCVAVVAAAAAAAPYTISVIHPIKDRLLHPMESSDPKEVAALQNRKGKGLGLPGMT